MRLARDPGVLRSITEQTHLEVRFIHVIRNPFDEYPFLSAYRYAD